MVLLDCLRDFCLAKVTTLVLVLRHSFENRSIIIFRIIHHDNYDNIIILPCCVLVRIVLYQGVKLVSWKRRLAKTHFSLLGFVDCVVEWSFLIKGRRDDRRKLLLLFLAARLIGLSPS